MPCILRPVVQFNHTLLRSCNWHYGLVFSGYRGSFPEVPEVKQPMREVGHSPASSAEVKNKWSYTSASLMYLHGVGRDEFTFTHEWPMNRPLSAGRDYVFSIVVATLHVRRPSPPPATHP
jgi:hypothetical protein